MEGKLLVPFSGRSRVESIGDDTERRVYAYRAPLDETGQTLHGEPFIPAAYVETRTTDTATEIVARGDDKLLYRNYLPVAVSLQGLRAWISNKRADGEVRKYVKQVRSTAHS